MSRSGDERQPALTHPDARRTLRRRATAAEVRLWNLVRDRRLSGLKFRRQYAIAGFIADFYCDTARLVVELDGPVHDERAEADRFRDTVLSTLGIRVLRVTNAELSRSPRAVLVRIILAVEHGHPS